MSSQQASPFAEPEGRVRLLCEAKRAVVALGDYGIASGDRKALEIARRIFEVAPEVRSA